MTDHICVIPARYASSRFPGKPLVPLLGVPMIIWVARAAAEALGRDSVLVATEDTRIVDVVEEYGFIAMMTSPNALTGTDRVAEVAQEFQSIHTVLNVQGDEPLVLPQDILAIAREHETNPRVVVNGYSTLEENEEVTNLNIPKVVMDKSEKLLYISRSPIPGTKELSPYGSSDTYLKQVCIYAYSPEHLALFAREGQKTPLEEAEDIEILRFLELGLDVQMVGTAPGSLAVDSPGDVLRVERVMEERGFRVP